MSEIPKPTSYALIVDERKNHILGSLYEAVQRSETARAVFDILLGYENITAAELNEFVKDWADREHELGWCKDPDCRYKAQQI